MSRLTFVIAAAATVAAAVLFARRSMAASSSPLEPDPEFGYGWDWLPTFTPSASDSDPYDQLPSVFESAIVTATPSTHFAPSNAPAAQAANLRAFLDMIAFAEGTSGANGYRMLFGGTLFDSYAEHPRVYVPFRDTTTSAAGRYQILWRTWKVLKDRLSLPDFSPASQDAAAVELIRERGALNDVYAGRVAQAVEKVARVWASLPGAGYNQPERKLASLVSAFQQAGGTYEA